ncbi:transglycosylase domain-containing protein [Cardinium endosymbiont of Tipula unca]|uniref:transglycosylase domain-containing protein n=1 Tax=Cardinium endosymbiont of Tipula unca TaxID=3066216 RepID=UPI0030D14FB6
MNEKKIVKNIWKLFAAVIVGISTYLFSVQVNFYNLYGGMPSAALLENPQSELASELYASDGVLLGKYFRNNRSSVTYEEISPNMINALIASEDYRFEKHAGIDLRGLSRAFFLSILLQQKKGGGSTLTQQLAKNLFNTRGEINYRGKCSKIPLLNKLVLKTKEWILAVQLERAYTKQEIIAMYLNTVTFGSNTYGIKVAARTFFGKTPAELRVEEAALLVGLLRAPSRYSPITNPERAKDIRNVVLSQMVKYGFLKKSDYNLIYEMPIELQYQEENYEQGMAPYFRAVVRDFLLTWTKENGYDLFADGLRVYTTIDSKVQAHAETALKEHMKQLQHTFDNHWIDQNPWIHENGKEITDYIEKEIKKTTFYKRLLKKYQRDIEAADLELHTPVTTELFSWEGPIKSIISPLEAFKHHRKVLQGGCMAMDPNTGHIKAWVGGINYKYFQYDHVKQSKRQAGSTFKPIVYTVALDNDYLPTDLVVDEPVTFSQPNGDTWTAQNAWKSYSGKKYTLRYAMAKSYNSITSYLIKHLTPELVVDYATRMGIKGPLDPVPALCLGCSDVSIYEMVGAYSAFLNKGVWTQPFFITHIEDKNGNIVQTFVPQRNEAIHEDTADLMTYMLQGSLDEGALSSVSKELRQDNDIAGKSGTTSNHSDGWFIGLTQHLCTGVWVGGEDRCIHFRDFSLGNGSATARPIWEKFIIKLYNDPNVVYQKGPLVDPSTLSQKVKKIIQNKEQHTTRKTSDGLSNESSNNTIKKVENIELDVNNIF